MCHNTFVSQQPGTTEAYRELHKDLMHAKLRYQQTMDALLGGSSVTQIHVVDGIIAHNGDPLRKLHTSQTKSFLLLFFFYMWTNLSTHHITSWFIFLS